MATMKQELAAKKMMEKVGKPIGQAMREAGYADNTADNPEHLTKSKGWRELMDKYLPDTKLAKVHAESLDANKVISAQVFPGGKDGKPVNDFIEVPDHQVRLKAVEVGYKVKDKYPKDKPFGDKDAPLHITWVKPDEAE